MACVHNTASVGDSKVALKAGKILKIESKWKTYFGWRLFWTSSFPSPLALSCSSLSHAALPEAPLEMIYSVFFWLVYLRSHSGGGVRQTEYLS